VNRQKYIYSSVNLFFIVNVASVVLNISYVSGKYTAFCFLSSYSKSYSLSILPQVWHLRVHLLLLPLVLHPWMGLNLIRDLPVCKMRNVSKSIIWKMRGCLVFLHKIRYVLSIYFPVNCILWMGAVLYWESSNIQVNVVPYVCSRPLSLLSNSILNAIHL
jgi:hypothetical protein